jgi:histidinol-phosphate aminotransferase
MTTYNQVPEYIRKLVPYVPGKPIEETQREFNLRRVIKLASNENPLGPSPKALLAARECMRDLHRYPDASAYELKHALAAHLNVAPQSIVLGNGSNEIIDFLIRTYCIPGDSIVTCQAAFVAYKICAQIHGVNTVEVPLDAELRFSSAEMVRTVEKNPRARVVFIANPNNPTGTYVTTQEMKVLLDRLSKIRGGSVLIALDYAYWEYVTAKDLPDPMELLRQYPNVVVMRTFSKVYGMAGMRIGYGVAAPEIISHLEKVRQPFNMNSISLAGAVAALSDKAFVKKARMLNAQGMKFWEKELKALGIPFWKSQGNFILADVQKATGMSGAEAYQACLRKGVIFRPVTNYGLAHALRISIGTMAENRAGIRALKTLFPKASAKGKK